MQWYGLQFFLFTNEAWGDTDDDDANFMTLTETAACKDSDSETENNDIAADEYWWQERYKFEKLSSDITYPLRCRVNAHRFPNMQLLRQYLRSIYTIYDLFHVTYIVNKQRSSLSKFLYKERMKNTR